jgi:hypothetical protein
LLTVKEGGGRVYCQKLQVGLTFIPADPLDVGAAEGCDLLIFLRFMRFEEKIAAFGSSYESNAVPHFESPLA